DTVATDEFTLSDNDYLSAIVAAIAGADLVVLLSDIDGLYSDDPNLNPDAKRIPTVDVITDEMLDMAGGPTTDLGTGGMISKLEAAGIANDAGADMVIINGNDMDNIERLFNGEDIGTLFTAHKTKHFHLKNYLDRTRL
ncbi:MAG: glutamate 5-kinase, partial [Eubacterium sp.]|nr:glutamate 5-kinase [Eubacterium sp.]